MGLYGITSGSHCQYCLYGYGMGRKKTIALRVEYPEGRGKNRLIEGQQRHSAEKIYSAAKDKILVSQELHDAGHYGDSISRCYYAAFHLVTLTLYLHGKSFSSHSQLIGAFNREIVASGFISRDTGKALHRLLERRQRADYDVFELPGFEDSLQSIEDIKLIL